MENNNQEINHEIRQPLVIEDTKLDLSVEQYKILYDKLPNKIRGVELTDDNKLDLLYGKEIILNNSYKDVNTGELLKSTVTFDVKNEKLLVTPCNLEKVLENEKINTKLFDDNISHIKYKEEEIRELVNNGSIVATDPDTGKDYYLSYNKETNRIQGNEVDSIILPDKIQNVQLTNDEKLKLLKGDKLDIKYNNGTYDATCTLELKIDTTEKKPKTIVSMTNNKLSPTSQLDGDKKALKYHKNNDMEGLDRLRRNGYDIKNSPTVEKKIIKDRTSDQHAEASLVKLGYTKNDVTKLNNKLKDKDKERKKKEEIKNKCTKPVSMVMGGIKW